MAQEYKICLETFIRWEQLTGRSFQSMNFDDEGDLHRLLYCAYWVGTGCDSTFEIFTKTLSVNPRYYTRAMKELTRYNTLAAQFASLAPSVQAETEAEQGDSQFMSDVAARLVIVGGMDARYVMREMSVEDMLLFVKALDDKQRQEMESQRLWTYLAMLPHVDGKKLDSPQKLMMFPWEVEKHKQEVKRVTDEARAEFEAFMRGGIPSAPKEKEE